MNQLCKKFKKNAAAYLDGELSQAETDVIDRHLQICRGCREEAQQLESSLRLLETWPAIAPSESYDRTFWRKLAEVRTDPKARKRPQSREGFLQWLFRPGLALPATAALAVCLFMLAYFTSGFQRRETRKELTAAPDMELLLNMEVIENSEALEHFEIISLLDVLEQELEG